MKVILKTIVIGLGCLSISCANKKNIKVAESQFLTDSIYSKYLSEYRKHNIYLPKGFDKNKNYPIIYATDGDNDLEDMMNQKSIFDSLIDHKIIEPLIFVASYNNPKIADSTSMTLGNGEKVYLQYRNFEYVDNYTDDTSLQKRFSNHKSYFTKELIPEFEQKYNQHIDSNNRYFYGFSNGAGFGISLLNSNPNIIGNFICFSTFANGIQTYSWDKNRKYPNLYLRYGSEEPLFLEKDAEYLTANYKELNSFIEVKKFEGGHESKIWKQEFTNLISNLFKK